MGNLNRKLGVMLQWRRQILPRDITFLEHRRASNKISASAHVAIRHVKRWTRIPATGPGISLLTVGLRKHGQACQSPPRLAASS